MVAGVTNDRGERRDSWFVVRLDRAGRLDPSFGGDGVVTINLSHHVLEPAPGYFGTDLRDMALDSDGRILLAGNAASHDHDSETDEYIDVYFSTLVRIDSGSILRPVARAETV